MSLTTTEARLRSILEGVAGVGNVHDRIRTEIDNTLTDGYMQVGGIINVWEFQLDTEELLDGADGATRSEGVVSILVHYQHDDAGDSRGTLRDLIQVVGIALTNTTTGFPQMKAPGVQTVQPPTPVKTRTGHSAYQVRLAFRLWDVSNT